jgi:two-component system response regulator TctD
MRYLLVEDSIDVAVPVLRYFEARGNAMDHAATLELAEASIRVQEYDAVILDLNMPDGNGMDMLARLRRGACQIPVLILSVNHSVETRLKGFDVGANDYLLKPFDLRELDARLRNLIHANRGETGRTCRVGDLELDLRERKVTWRGEAVTLAPKDVALLEILVVNANRPVSKTVLQDKLYAFGDEIVSPNAIELRIARIRKKLEHTQIGIKALWGIGYQIEQEQ